MKVAIVYIYSPIAGPKYEAYADRFLESYHTHHPGGEHETVVVLNGTPATTEVKCRFCSLPNCRFLEHDNSGYDIGGFQFAARTVPCDLMVFFGASTFFRREGWLLKMVKSFKDHGIAQYGAMGNRGDLAVKVWPHIRTTAFWMPPELMNEYPLRITRPEQRHPFEHGKNCFTAWVGDQGLKSWVVTWSGDSLWRDWDNDPEGFQRGRQTALLAYDHICEPPYYPRR